MQPDQSTLGSRLVEARLALGVGQDVVAKAARLSQQSYSDLETGKSKGTTKLGSLAHALGVDAYWLETGIGERRLRVGEAPATYMSADRRQLLELFEAMPERKRKALLQLLEP